MTTEQFRQRFIVPPLTNRELYPTKLITNSCIFFRFRHFLPSNRNRSSRVSWNTCASTCVRKRCSISSTRTSSSRASNPVARKASSVNWSRTTLTTCPASTSYLLWYLTYFHLMLAGGMKESGSFHRIPSNFLLFFSLLICFLVQK